MNKHIVVFLRKFSQILKQVASMNDVERDDPFDAASPTGIASFNAGAMVAWLNKYRASRLQ